ncbi:hypothetical protein EAO76_40560 [Streptomyces sp. sk2.1]|nr:hypothetical protein EAO76_40560 [Streptomyces sp. sk2.1]
MPVLVGAGAGHRPAAVAVDPDLGTRGRAHVTRDHHRRFRKRHGRPGSRSAGGSAAARLSPSTAARLSRPTARRGR